MLRSAGSFTCVATNCVCVPVLDACIETWHGQLSMHCVISLSFVLVSYIWFLGKLSTLPFRCWKGPLMDTVNIPKLQIQKVCFVASSLVPITLSRSEIFQHVQACRACHCHHWRVDNRSPVCRYLLKGLCCRNQPLPPHGFMLSFRMSIASSLD